MNIEELRDYCLAKKGCTESFPFDENVLAFKVGNKIFGLTNIHSEQRQINLKCDPERAIQLRQDFPEQILPGYHMSKKHWNTINYEQIPLSMVQELVDHSYNLVVQNLPKSTREQIQNQ